MSANASRIVRSFTAKNKENTVQNRENKEQNKVKYKKNTGQTPAKAICCTLYMYGVHVRLHVERRARFLGENTVFIVTHLGQGFVGFARMSWVVCGRWLLPHQPTRDRLASACRARAKTHPEKFKGKYRKS